MPWECIILDRKPESLIECPNCGTSPFESFMRGHVQRPQRKWIFCGRKRPYCCVICSECKKIVAYEDPLTCACEVLPKRRKK